MDSAFLLSLQQLVLGETPLTASEVREMFLRHVASAPQDFRSNPMTICLAALYNEVILREEDRYASHLHYKEVEPTLRKSFREGFLYVLPNKDPDLHYTSPSSLLYVERDYPRDLIEQLGAVLGYQAARSLSDLSNSSNNRK